MKSPRILRSFFALFLCVLLAAALIPASRAAAKITESVNLSRPQKNQSGSGYYWDNIHDVLTLDGLYIDTSDEFGMRIPPDATVILKGNNTITASRAALACPGSVTFKGSGTLTLSAGDMGIYFYSTDDSTTARFLEGEFRITSGGDGIRSDSTALSFVGSRVTISAPAADRCAVEARSIKLFGGTVTADAPLRAALNLEARAMTLDVTAQRSALSAGKKLLFTDVSIAVGASADALTSADEYAGENCVRLRSTARRFGQSVLFGEGVSSVVDILLLLLFVVLIAAGIAVPFLRARRKAKRAREAAAAAMEEGK